MSARDQAGVIPFRRKRNAVEICLIRNKGSQKWKIPKGFVDPGETVRQAALKEAWEEAGLRGRIVGDALGSYEYEKWNMGLTVAVFLMEVRTEEDEWEESRFRERRWALLDQAFAWLRKHPVKPLLADAAARLGRKRQKA
jgi:8-oxo-dGTP pyrophosphatase MutT (NUDIX family)